MEKAKSILLQKPNVKLFSGTIDTLNETETNIIATGHNTDSYFQLKKFHKDYNSQISYVLHCHRHCQKYGQ